MYLKRKTTCLVLLIQEYRLPEHYTPEFAIYALEHIWKRSI